jgi:hypothetical protein
MASSIIKKAYGPTLAMCLFSLLLLNTNNQAQSLKRHLVTKIQDEGTLYFINPLIDFKGEKSKLEYDITYLANNDSATFNFTYFTKELYQIDSILFINATSTSRAKVNKLFVDHVKNKWEHRYSARIPLNELQVFLTDENPGDLVLLSTDSVKKNYSLNNGKWKKQKELLSKIFDLIEANS